jgi:hypothetical protein
MATTARGHVLHTILSAQKPRTGLGFLTQTGRNATTHSKFQTLYQA